MTASTAKRLAEKTGGSIRETYSGRCMYGQTTHAVVMESYELTPAMRKKYRVDSMGLKIVVY